MRALLISDFSINNLSGYLKNDLGAKTLQTTIAPFNQVHQVLINDKLDCWSETYDFTVLWTQPERVLKNFSHFLNNEDFNFELLKSEVENFADLIIQASHRIELLFVSSWTVDQSLHYKGKSNTKSEIGVVDVLSQMNRILREKLNPFSKIILLDSSKWISMSGAIAYSPKLWYLSKTPFHSTVFANASKDIVSILDKIKGNSRKLIITDLDNTLWGGVIGDVGIENIVLGGHDPKGEAFQDFQRGLKALSNTGIVLAISSKNEESVALNAIENHPEMWLKKNDFVAWRINWNDKAQNILEITQELNLGLDSVVFLDDNSFERERVKHALPEVLVPELPTDPLLYKHFLLQLDCFNSGVMSDEDKNRTALYALEKNRQNSKKEFSSVEDWLKSINIKVSFESLNTENFQRVLQLLNKTNQMNLLTNRYSETELLRRLNNNDDLIFAFSVKDNFGDAGLTGVIGLRIENDNLVFTDFVLSCRVIGRKVEETMLSVAVDLAKKKELKNVIANYIETEKNKPCFDFFKNSGFIHKNNAFYWDAEKRYSRPYYIELETIA